MPRFFWIFFNSYFKYITRSWWKESFCFYICGAVASSFRSSSKQPLFFLPIRNLLGHYTLGLLFFIYFTISTPHLFYIISNTFFPILLFTFTFLPVLGFTIVFHIYIFYIDKIEFLLIRIMITYLTSI